MPERHRNAAIEGDRRLVSRGERQRREVLNALERLLATTSILDLTVGQIAVEAQVTRPAFYTYFTSKYAALAVLTSEIWAKNTITLHLFDRQPGESPEKFLHRGLTNAVESTVLDRAVISAARQAALHDRQLAEMWQAWQRGIADSLAHEIRADIEAGIAKPSPRNINDLSRDLMEMTVHLIHTSIGRGDDHGHTVDTLTTMWLATGWGRC